MALLQISEPGQSPAPHQRSLAVGIDLGTTHSLVASVRSGQPEILNDAQARGLLPSVVTYLDDGSVRVGWEALTEETGREQTRIASFKRFMGRSAQDAHAVDAPYTFAEGEGMARVQTVQGPRTPVEISAEVLRVLRERAEAALGGDLVGAVITVPAYFDDAQRQATRDAAQLAGLNVLRLLNEPTAAAIAYGLDHQAEGIYAVYDLGGGTFDLSILRLSKGVFEVIATGGDTTLGGDDFDAAIVQHVLAQSGDAVALSHEERKQLLIEARRVRESLTDSDSAVFEAVLVSGRAVHCTLTRTVFHALAQPLIERTLQWVRRALRDAALQVADIKGVVMVGGATRMPVVRQAVEVFFGRPPFTELDPDKVVALGAALQANLLAGNHAPGDDWLLLDVIPLSLGIETMGGLVERIIGRNSTIPVARAQEFTTFKDGQGAMSFHVVQGERELVSDCRSLARFELRGIPPMTAGAARIRVTFQVDADGLLNVSAQELSTGVQATISVKPSYGLSDDEIARMLADGMAQADADAQARMLREAQVDARRLVESVDAALQVDADLLDAQERIAVDDALNAARQCDLMDDTARVRAAIEQLTQATDAFAARRMDRSIRAALAGRAVDDILS